MDEGKRETYEGSENTDSTTRIILYVLCLYIAALLCVVTAQTAEATIAEALDNSQLVWTTGGTEPWRPETWITRYDGDAAWIGELSGRGLSWVETMVQGAGTLEFHWKVSGADQGVGSLKFYIDGDLAPGGEITGTTGWVSQTYTLPGDPDTVHTLRWVYVRKNEGAWYADNAYLDKVVWSAASAASAEEQIAVSETLLPAARGPELK